MASASSSYYISFLFAMLCMCLHLFAGAFAQQDSIPLQTSPPKISTQSSPSPPSPSPSPAPAPEPAPAPTPSPTPSPAPTPSSPVSVPTSFFNLPESAKHKRGRILGLVLIFFAGVLQAFVVLFLFVKRRQMWKHVHRSRDHRDSPHIWSNPYKEADTDCKQVHFGITRSPNLFVLKLGRVLAAIKEGMCVM